MSKSPNVYIVPPGGHQLQDNLFATSDDGTETVWSFARDYCKRKGFILKTADFWHTGDTAATVIVLDHPSQDLAHRIIYFGRFMRMTLFGTPFFKLRYHNFNQFLSKFSKRILFHFEPAVVTPSVYKNLPRLKRLYDEIYLTSQIDGLRYFHMPQTFDSPVEPFFSNRDRKFLVMMNSNKRPLQRKNELYSERLKAIKYFSEHSSIDLYGAFWDRPIFFPFTLYKKYVSKVYQGFVDNKFEAMSRYRFAICFENEISPGFITEKIFDCFLAGTIPIYYGAPNVTDYIPAGCFIDFREFRDYNHLREYLESLSLDKIDEYRENIQAFYKSGKFRDFDRESLAKIIMESLK